MSLLRKLRSHPFLYLQSEKRAQSAEQTFEWSFHCPPLHKSSFGPFLHLHVKNMIHHPCAAYDSDKISVVKVFLSQCFDCSGPIHTLSWNVRREIKIQTPSMVAATKDNKNNRK